MPRDACPGEGADRRHPLLDADENLRRAADECCRRCLQQEHERTGIHNTQRPIDVEWSGSGLELESLAEHHLEDVTRPDVFLALVDGRLELNTGEVGLRHLARRCSQPNILGLQINRLRHQEVAQFIDPAAGIVIRGANVALLGPGMGDDEQHLADVIEYHHPVIQTEAQVGELPVVGRRTREILRVADDVVAGIADGPPTKARQLSQLDSRETIEQFLQFAERVGHCPPGGDTFLGVRDFKPAGLDGGERIAADEAVPSHPLSTDNTFKQKGVGSISQLAKGGDRCQGVREELPIDGHQLSSLGQLRESFEGRKVGHVRRARSIRPNDITDKLLRRKPCGR